jgi:salicylate hydroxylase
MPPHTHAPALPCVVAGAGIGGLACALALSRAGRAVTVLERAPLLQEVGAGIQLGPNAVAVLEHLGVMSEYMRVACTPSHLQVRDVTSGRELARMPLHGDMERRYGQPYTTVHRADLHGLLLQAAGVGARVQTDAMVTRYAQQAGHVQVLYETASGVPSQTDSAVLIGADGLWSRVRQQMLGDGEPIPTGHVAYRGLVDMAQLPTKLRTQHITVWMGERLHAVVYPVKAGQALNVVLVSAGQVTGDPQTWSAQAPAQQLHAITAHAHGQLQETLQAVTQLHGWQLWALNGRLPIAAQHYTQGLVALLGDAAHPMRPYLAQGAAMALEDAAVLGQCVAQETRIEPALRSYAAQRWQRNARVQRTAQRNGDVFHATGLMRFGRDLALRALGAKLLDTPWLYGHQAVRSHPQTPSR